MRDSQLSVLKLPSSTFEMRKNWDSLSEAENVIDSREATQLVRGLPWRSTCDA